MAETEADLKADGVLGKYAKIIAITHAPVERVLKNVSRAHPGVAVGLNR